MPHAAGGRTAAHNLQGLCERCNHNRQALGWRATAHEPPTGDDPSPHPPSDQARNQAPDQAPDRHTVVTTTPTGHSYVSVAPALPGTGHLAVRLNDPPAAPDARPDPDAEQEQEQDSPVEGWLRTYLALAA